MEPSGLAYDASEIVLRHEDRIPAHDWHPAALLRTLQRGCSNASFRHNRQLLSPLEQAIVVPAAAARLGEIGFNLDELVKDTFRSGRTGEFVRVSTRIAYDLNTPLVEVPDVLEHLGLDVIRRTRPRADGETFPAYLQAVVRDPAMTSFTRRAAGWVGTSELRALLLWRIPTSDEWDGLPELDPRATATESRWLADRFLLTFLTHWATSSLHEEFKWARGKRAVSIGAEYMDLRHVPGERLNAEIADRAVEGEPVDPSALLMGAVELLRGGEYDQAAALFQGALAVSDSNWVKNGLAFCLVPSDPAASAAMFRELLGEEFNVPLLHANLAATSRLLGDLDEARSQARLGLVHLEGSSSSDSFLWGFAEGELTLIEVDLRTYLKFVLDWQ